MLDVIMVYVPLVSSLLLGYLALLVPWSGSGWNTVLRWFALIVSFVNALAFWEHIR